jgi:hypothetical protein
MINFSRKIADKNYNQKKFKGGALRYPDNREKGVRSPKIRTRKNLINGFGTN